MYKNKFVLRVVKINRKQQTTLIIYDFEKKKLKIKVRQSFLLNEN